VMIAAINVLGLPGAVVPLRMLRALTSMWPAIGLGVNAPHWT
jgi:hypothetical protein